VANSLLLVLSITALWTTAAPATGREEPAVSPIPLHVPGPDAIVARDDLLTSPCADAPSGSATRELSALEAERVRKAIAAMGTPTTGGDDLLLFDTVARPQRLEMDVTSDGVLYLAMNTGTNPTSVWVLRSEEGGVSFDMFGDIAAAGQDVILHRLLVCEGVENRIYILFQPWPTSDIKIAWAELSGSVAAWTTRTAFAETGGFPAASGALASDEIAFSGYWLNAVARSSTAGDVYFSRSLDFGETWSAPYSIATAPPGYLMDLVDVSCGFGNAVHTTWMLRNIAFSQGAIRYRRALNWANNGIADWDPALEITSLGTGVHLAPEIEGSNGNAVVITYDDDTTGLRRIRASTDASATWPSANGMASGLRSDSDVFTAARHTRLSASSDRFVLGGFLSGNDDIGFQTAPASSPLSWGPVEILSSDPAPVRWAHGVATDPTRGDRVAMVWAKLATPVFDDVWFDAEWRSDPGWPMTEFIVPLESGTEQPTAPALVNIDADPYDEIIFSDAAGKVHVVSHEGIEEEGWPRAIGGVVNIAVGDLNGDGAPEIVAGDMSGRVHVLNANGAYAGPTWPFTVGSGRVAVSIGALGGASPRSFFATNGQFALVIGYSGVVDQTWVFPNTFTAPGAIGDLDSDGTNEIVTVNGYQVDVLRVGAPGSVVSRNLGDVWPVEQAALADMDLNGDLEIIVTTEQSDVYVMHGDLTDFVGFPISVPDATALHGPVGANILGTAEPEIVVAQGALMHVFLYTGIEATVGRGSSTIRSSPIRC